MAPRDRQMAELLSGKGTEFSEYLKNENQDYFDDLDYSYFAVAAAIGLTWTKHAQLDGDFISYAAGYIDGVVAKDPLMAGMYAARFGEKDLDNALHNYRLYYQKVKGMMPNFYACDMNTLVRLQTRLLSKLNDLRSDGQVSGIGPWLFTGPFKIILSDQSRLWKEDGINSIVLPTGSEVNKGINRLIKEKYPFVAKFDKNWLEMETSSLLDNYATYSLVHTFIENIGQITNTPALHINSALYLYGRNDI